MSLGDGIRRNIAHVDPAERRLLRDAFVELNRRRYPGTRADQVPGGVTFWFKQDEIHQATHVHGGPEFIPWHREIVNRLEQLLRDVDPRLSLHYWDWTDDPRAIHGANLGGGQKGTLNLFTPDFMGYGGPVDQPIGTPWLEAGYYVPGASPHRDSSDGNAADPPRSVIRSVAGSPATDAQDQAIVDAGDFASMRAVLEPIHNAMHGFVSMGGQHISFRDPFVFLLHSNMDRLFSLWQLHPGHPERLDPARVYGSESGDPRLNSNIEPWSTGHSTDSFGVEHLSRPWCAPENQGVPKAYKHPSVVAPPRYDTNPVELRRAEIVWHNRQTNETQIWEMDGARVAGRTTVVSEQPVFVGPPFEIVGAGDLSGDGKPDIVWHHSQTNETQIWNMDGGRIAGRTTVVGEDGQPAFVGPPFEIVGVADAQIIWHHSQTGETQIWRMDGGRIASRATVVGEDGQPAFVGLPFEIVGVGDLTGDGKADIVWHNADTNETQVWAMNGARIGGRATVVGEDGSPIFVGPPFEIVGVGDLTGDGKADIVWHNADTNETQLWAMNGARIAGRATVVGEDGNPIFVGPPFEIVGVARTQIVWHNRQTNETQLWQMAGNRIAARVTAVAEQPLFVGPPFEIVGAGDLDGDGKVDVVWHNADTNETQVWEMDGRRIAGRATVVGEDGNPIFVGPPFEIVGVGDMTGDGKADIVWHNSQTNETQIWAMDGGRIARRVTVVGEDGQPAFVGPPFEIVGIGDLNGDGKADIVWHNSQTNETQAWLMDGGRVARRVTVVGEDGQPTFVGLPFEIVGAARSEIVWHNNQTNETQIWAMEGGQIAARRTVVGEDGQPAFVGLPFEIVGVGAVR